MTTSVLSEKINVYPLVYFILVRLQTHYDITPWPILCKSNRKTNYRACYDQKSLPVVGSFQIKYYVCSSFIQFLGIAVLHIAVRLSLFFITGRNIQKGPALWGERLGRCGMFTSLTPPWSPPSTLRPAPKPPWQCGLAYTIN